VSFFSIEILSKQSVASKIKEKKPTLRENVVKRHIVSHYQQFQKEKKRKEKSQ
jgi:hypothetical protein